MTLASDAVRIFRAGVAAVAPAMAVRANLHRRGPRLRVGARSFTIRPAGTVRLVAIGKAAGSMVDAAAEAIGRPFDALAVTPRGFPGSARGLKVLFGEHPIPGAGSFEGGQALLNFVRAASPGDLTIFLISGGGSAVAEVPAAGLTPGDLSRTTKLLLASGAPIIATNAVRRHLSGIKGGQLATTVRSNRFATLALSDVVGDLPEEIASGPTVPDPSTFRDAISAARRFGLSNRLPPRVRQHLRMGARRQIPETPKPGDSRFTNVPFVLVGSNRTALEGAAHAARSLGYRTEVVPRPVVGATRPAALRFARRLLEYGLDFPRALLAGGETTVVLGPRPGRGGRNQEFALGVARAVRGRNVLVLSAGTDGIDGPTDAAGGWVDGESWTRAANAGVDVGRALACHASYDALDRLDSLLRTGPTGTNVTDLHVGLVGRRVSQSRAGSRKRGAAPSSRRRRS